MENASASLSNLSSQGTRILGPSLTPSLANYFRADLITHVTGWPAEMLEKQVYIPNQYFKMQTLKCLIFKAQKCCEEAHIIGNLQCTRVSADLKIARSLVRITEITATLQEQK